MSVLSAKETLKNLKKKGFTDSIKRSDDHLWVEFWHNEDLIITTKISHGAKDLDDYLIKQMSRQCKIDKAQFMDLAKCPLSKEKYIELLKEKGLIK
jgi:predicted RNA binding protein YcfA (HicA-like mRNA interferase family)